VESGNIEIAKAEMSQFQLTLPQKKKAGLASGPRDDEV
jgi:hypothetical protein